MLDVVLHSSVKLGHTPAQSFVALPILREDMRAIQAYTTQYHPLLLFVFVEGPRCMSRQHALLLPAVVEVIAASDVGLVFFRVIFDTHRQSRRSVHGRRLLYGEIVNPGPTMLANISLGLFPSL